jgi:dihydroxy-acid dehydratase
MPIKPNGCLVILKGKLAPEGYVVKVAGHELVHHSGQADVFDSEEEAFAAARTADLCRRSTWSR